MRRKMSKTIGLNRRGRLGSEVYRVCEDVYTIVDKMLSANKAIGPFSRHSQFEFEEVSFILGLLGVSVDEGLESGIYSVDLWISEV